MRYLIQEPNAYANAVVAIGELKSALIKEIYYFARYWKPDRHSSSIFWMSDDEVMKLKGEGLCGSSEGMYLVETCDEDADLYFYLPKTTEAYNKFYDSICCLHDSDDKLFFETIPYFVDIEFNGKNEIEFAILCNVEECGKEVYESAVKIAKEMVELLGETVCFEKISFYEGDDDGNIGYKKKHQNYFVGVKIGYELNY